MSACIERSETYSYSLMLAIRQTFPYAKVSQKCCMIYAKEKTFTKRYAEYTPALPLKYQGKLKHNFVCTKFLNANAKHRAILETPVSTRQRQVVLFCYPVKKDDDVVCREAYLLIY